MDKTQIASRMKENYEKRSRTFLTRRTPVIIRIDGKCFHTFTKGFDKPFSEELNYLMCETTRYLCENIQGCKLGYTQSDEISLLITDYDKLTTDAWFDYNVQKMCSISASMATMKFNDNWIAMVRSNFSDFPYGTMCSVPRAQFDSRCFNIPRGEVINYFIWRQLDFVRNSVQMLGQSLFSHKELHGKGTGDVKEMCFQKGHNWQELPTKWRNGNLCFFDIEHGWLFKTQIDDFRKQEFRNFVNTLIYGEIKNEYEKIFRNQ